jgi:hypothetical protein
MCDKCYWNFSFVKGKCISGKKRNPCLCYMYVERKDDAERIDSGKIGEISTEDDR